MIDPNFDPLAMMQQMQLNQQQLDSNQKQIVLAINNWQQTMNDHEQRLNLNQETINQILSSLQNQQKLIMSVFEELVKVQAVNNEQGQQK
jgi:hypothetical protein